MLAGIKLLTGEPLEGQAKQGKVQEHWLGRSGIGDDIQWIAICQHSDPRAVFDGVANDMIRDLIDCYGCTLDAGDVDLFVSMAGVDLDDAVACLVELLHGDRFSVARACHHYADTL